MMLEVLDNNVLLDCMKNDRLMKEQITAAMALIVEHEQGLTQALESSAVSAAN